MFEVHDVVFGYAMHGMTYVRLVSSGIFCTILIMCESPTFTPLQREKGSALILLVLSLLQIQAPSDKTRGYSAMRFLPGTGDQQIVAAKVRA